MNSARSPCKRHHSADPPIAEHDSAERPGPEVETDAFCKGIGKPRLRIAQRLAPRNTSPRSTTTLATSAAPAGHKAVLEFPQVLVKNIEIEKSSPLVGHLGRRRPFGAPELALTATVGCSRSPRFTDLLDSPLRWETWIPSRGRQSLPGLQSPIDG